LPTQAEPGQGKLSKLEKKMKEELEKNFLGKFL
jgi:hypothetical protein